MTWNPLALPDQSGKTIVVTGASRGVGYFVAEQLAAVGAKVVIAARSADRAATASVALRGRVPNAQLAFVRLDLGSLASIRDAAAELGALGPIDVLVNNAGLTGGSRQRQTTVDGLELIVGTNALGPFALTAQLFPALAPHGRVISLGSLSTRLAKADLDNLLSERGTYSLSRAYATSKHAVHAFAFELDRRLRAVNSGRSSILAHPGFALDGPAEPRAGVTDLNSRGQRAAERAMGVMAQGKDRGAWPVVRAAIDPDAQGGEFYGPKGLVKGQPVTQKAVAQSADAEFGRRLWELSEELTGVPFVVTS